MIPVLKRYMGIEFLKALIATIVALILLFHLIDLIEHADNFLHKGAGMKDVVLYYLYLTPQYFTLFLPYSLLIAATVTLVIRSRFNETIAAFASGVSLWSLLSPIILISIVASATSLLVSEKVVPVTSLKARELRAQYIKTSERAARFFQNRYWLKVEDAVITAQVLDREKSTLYGITILYLEGEGNLTKRIDAESGTYDGKWYLQDVEILTLGPKNKLARSKSMSLTLPATFDSFFSAQKHTSDMSLGELRRYIKEIKRKGYAVQQYLVDFHSRIAYAFLSVVIVLLAAPFSLTPARKGVLVASVGIAIFVGFACWGLFSISTALGRKGVIPAALSAWLPIFLITVAATFFYRRMRV